MISVRGDVKEVERYLTALEKRQVPFAARVAVKKTADNIARKTIPAILPRIFDRPTKWTERGFYSYQPRGTKAPVAYVNIKDGGTNQPTRGGKIGTPAFNYLRTQMKGGNRLQAKRHEIALRRMRILDDDEYTVPGKDMRLDRFGNLTGKAYSKILADVNNTYVAAGRDDIQQGFGQRTTKRGKRRYFYHPNLRPRGIYERTSKSRIRVALLFIKAPRYQSRFDFYGISERAARKRFPIEFRESLQRAIDTAAARGKL